MRHRKPEKARILAAFGDIRGFTMFCDLVTNEETEHDPFFEKFDALVESISRRTGYTFSDTGDGFMMVVDLKPNHACAEAGEALIVLWNLYERINQMMEEMDAPRMNGFVVTGTYGYVRRKMRTDGSISLRGRQINLAHNLLEVAKNYGFVIHDSWRQLISDKQLKKLGFSITRATLRGPLPDSISRLDASLLWAVHRNAS